MLTMLTTTQENSKEVRLRVGESVVLEMISLKQKLKTAEKLKNT